MGRRRLLRFLFPFAVGVAIPGAGEAGAQTPPKGSSRVTLQAWEERARIQLLDREGTSFGRFGGQGLLQRFHPLMDAEYELDLLSSRFPLDEDALWYVETNGARFWSGSISHLRLVQEGDIRLEVPLAPRWIAGLRYWHQDLLQARRDLLVLEFAHLAKQGKIRAFLNGWLTARKAESDLEAGVRWQTDWGQGTVAVLALDAFSDIVYQSLGVGPALADTVLDYRRHPWAARTLWTLSPHRHWHLEAWGLMHPRSRIRVQRQRDVVESWDQEESYAYGGLLLQWTGLAGTTLGTFGTWRRGTLDRPEMRPDGTGAPRSPWRLQEGEGALGGVILHDVAPRVRLRGVAGWEGRREDRWEDGLLRSYRDEGWQGRLDLVLHGPRGLYGEVAFDARTLRQKGDLRVPSLEPLEGCQHRLRLDLGWRFGEKAFFLLGANLDLDQGGFDGGHGRFVLGW